MKNKMQIILKNELELANHLSLFLKKLGDKYNVPKNIISEIDLALGELVLNIIKYAYKNKQNSFIILDCDIENNKIIFILTDTAEAFNPLKYEYKNVDANLTDKPIGGLGIMIAKKSMDSISYERKDNKNQLKLVKFIEKK